MEKLHSGGVFEVEITEESSGFLSFVASGEGAKELFLDEAGGHRWQASSPTERHGRIHTSTITVAVLDLESDEQFQIDESDIEMVPTRGSGPGGQHKNRTESCIVATHKPSGISVRIDTRSQYQSRKIALQILNAKLLELDKFKKLISQNKDRKDQIGSGMRGDKIRTYREQDDVVMNHLTGKKMSLKKWSKGDW